MSHSQDDVHAFSLKEPEVFWLRQANQLSWHKTPSRALKRQHRELSNGVKHAGFSWYPDGEISTSYNCIDRHVEAGRGEVVAIIWESPVTRCTRHITYNQLLQEVEALAGVLREQGVQKGDVVLVYMPMIPEALFAILAINRLSAIHAVVFGGFAPAALAQRVDASKPKVIMTASCAIEGNKAPIAYQSFVEAAIQKCDCKPEKTIVWQRKELPWEPIKEDQRQCDWQQLVVNAKAKGLKAEAVPAKSDDGVYIIYTSGTTGQPKGVLREAGGHAVGLEFSMRYVFGIGPAQVIFCASDIGWVVGHSYIIYAPLLAGATTILFEGKPVGTPDAGTFWRILAKHKVNAMFTAPTALRAIKRDDPDNKYFASEGENGSLRHLRALFVAGERSEPSIIRTYQSMLDQYCAPEAQVVDNWWSSESGSPISSIALNPDAANRLHSTALSKPLRIKPGSAGKPMPGFDVRVVSDSGTELPRGVLGNIVLALPLAPTGFTTLFKDPERYYKGYLKRFAGRWLDTGDAGMIDEDGFVHVLSRSDDIINVAAHRFSTSTIEQAIASHPSIAECSVVGIPDSLKGHLPFGFATLSLADHPKSAIPDARLYEEVQALIKDQIGAIASLGGLIVGKGMIPKTRSGKTLRRVLRELVENAVEGHVEKAVQVPATVEDAGAVEVARAKVKEYFRVVGAKHRTPNTKSRL